MTQKIERTLAYRNKNPLNIRTGANWQGMDGEGRSGFCVFKGFSYGYRAAVLILRAYNLKGIRSIKDIISRWAPASENNTKAYIKAVVDFMNGVWRPEYVEFTENALVNLHDRDETVHFLMAVTKVEMGVTSPADMHYMRAYMYMGYDLAVTSKGFFDGVNNGE